jgi:hypothetical protein
MVGFLLSILCIPLIGSLPEGCFFLFARHFLHYLDS